jgi:heat shock protein HslJ
MGAPEIPRKKVAYISAIVFVALVLVIILVYAGITSNSTLNSIDADKGLPFITILDPGEGERLDLTWSVTIRGQAGGLINREINVQALDAAGNVLAEEQAIVKQDESEPGAPSTWEVDLQVNALLGSQGQILASSPSQADGSRLAEDRVTVGYGENPFKEDLLLIENHLWRLASLNERPPIEGTILTLQFERFQAAGDGGCNNFRSSFERSGSSLNFGIVTSTAKECELPPGIMAQESAYFGALEQVVNYKIEDTQMSLNDNSVIERLVYNAVVMGTIRGPENTNLPEEASIFVRLLDVTSSTPEPNIISESIIGEDTRLPLAYSLVYNPKQIIEEHTYVLEVQILDSSDNVLLISSGTDYVFTAGYPSLIDMVLVKPSN